MTTELFFLNKVKDFYFLNQNGVYEIRNPKKWLKNKTTENFGKTLDAEYCAKKVMIFLDKLLLEKKFNCVHDFSKTALGEICYNLQIIKDDHINNLSHSLCINLSTLIPYFHIHVLELKRNKTNFSKWSGIPTRNIMLEKKSYKSEIDSLKKILTVDLFLNEFPDFLVQKKIPEIYTNDIRKGEFTFYNAFFQREYDTR